MKTARGFLQSLIGFLILLIFSGSSFAAERIFIKEYTYKDGADGGGMARSLAQALDCDQELEAYCMFSAPANDPSCADFERYGPRCLGPDRPRNPGGDGLFRVCNRSRYVIGMTTAWYSRREALGYVISEGWSTMKPGQCVRVFDADSARSHRYYYAYTVGADYKWEGGGVRACAHPREAFRFVNPQDNSCPAGWSAVDYHVFGDSDLNLTAE